MAVQFTSAPAYHPTPFVIHDNNKNNTLTDLGEAFAALGNMPNQMQQGQIRDNLNQLLIKALTSPRTEMQPGANILKPGYSFSEDVPGNTQGLGTFAGNMSGEVPSISDMLTQSPSKEIPGKEYTDVTSRLGDVGYTGGGFNFAKKNKLEDLLTLEAAKGYNRSDLQTQKDEAAAKRLADREKTKVDLAKSGQEFKEKLQEKTIASNEKIAENSTLSKEKIAQMHEDNGLKKHADSIAEQKRRTEVYAKGIDNTNDMREATAARTLTTAMNSTLASIVKLKSAGEQNSPQRVGELRQLMNHYNQLQQQLEMVDPGTTTMPMTEQDAPFSLGGFIKGLLPGNVPAIDVTPKEGKAPAPNRPAPNASETPQQRRNRLLGR